jgi:hypothetical protein
MNNPISESSALGYIEMPSIRCAEPLGTYDHVLMNIDEVFYVVFAKGNPSIPSFVLQ